MFRNYFFFFSFLLVLSCQNKSEKTSKESENQYIVDYNVKGDSLYIHSGDFSYKFDKNQLPLSKIVLLNNSMVGFFNELDAENVIIGVSNPEYIYSKKIQKLIENGKIQNVGNEQQYDVEKIISLHPDIIITNYISTFENTYASLQNHNIKILFIDDYKIQSPLQKSKLISLIGVLVGKEKRANSIYQNVKKRYNNYKLLAEEENNKPKVITNEMYGDYWFVAGGQSYTAKFIEDANADYIFKNLASSKSIPVSFEEVYAKSKDVHYWVNVGNHTHKQELLELNPNYSKLDVYNHGELFSVAKRENNKANDFFESGVVYADKVLRDYVSIFHPSLISRDSLTYLKKLD